MKRKLFFILALAALMFTAFWCTLALAESGTEDHCFVVQPHITSYNTSREEFTVKWQTSFRPVKVEIYKKVDKYSEGFTYYLYDTRTNLNISRLQSRFLWRICRISSISGLIMARGSIRVSRARGFP